MIRCQKHTQRGEAAMPKHQRDHQTTGPCPSIAALTRHAEELLASALAPVETARNQRHILDSDRHSVQAQQRQALDPKGAGIAQWLERRTRDWKVAGSNPCWNGGRIFFSRVDFLCWLLFRYPFHPRVTTVARKKSRSFCQKCRWQVTAKYAYTLRMWLLLNRASALVTTCP